MSSWQERIDILKIYAVKQVGKLSRLDYQADDKPYILTAEEYAHVKYIYRSTYWISALLGALSVVVLFVPKYIYPAWFPRTNIHIPWLEWDFVYNIPLNLYGFLLAYIELFILYNLNLKAIRKMAAICRYPSPADPDFARHVELLAETGIEKSRKFGKELGFYPYQGLARPVVFVYLAMNQFKAILSNILIRVIVVRIGGRALGRVFIDMLGAPIFAFWNLFASRQVLKEAQVRIFATSLTRYFTQVFYGKYANEPGIQELIYEVLQYVSMMKRKYNYSHHNLANSLFEQFSVKKSGRYVLPKNYVQKWKELPEIQREALIRLLLFGVLVDGNLTAHELFLLHKLHEEGVIPFRIDEIRKFHRDYLKGKGLEEIVRYNLR